MEQSPAVVALVRARNRAQESARTRTRGKSVGTIYYPTRYEHGYADALEDALQLVQDAERERG